MRRPRLAPSFFALTSGVGVGPQRILDLLDKQLAGRTYLCGDEYTIADLVRGAARPGPRRS